MKHSHLPTLKFLFQLGIVVISICLLPSAYADLKFNNLTLNTRVKETIKDASLINSTGLLTSDTFDCSTEDDMLDSRELADQEQLAKTGSLPAGSTQRGMLSTLHIRGNNGEILQLPCDTFQQLPASNLTNNTHLGRADAHDKLVALVNIPSGISIRSINISEASWSLDWKQAGNQMLVWSVIPGGARDTYFTAIDNNGASYKLTVDVNLGISGCDSRAMSIFTTFGDNINVDICASGNSSQLHWHYQPVTGSTLPDGLNMPLPVNRNSLSSNLSVNACLQNTQTGILNCPKNKVSISGQITHNALTSKGMLQLRNSNNLIVAQQQLRIEVAPFPMPGGNIVQQSRDSWNLPYVQDVVKHTQINIPLPQPRGGDGINYEYRWQVGENIDYNQGRPLQPVNTSSGWFLLGSIGSGVTSDHVYDIPLELHAANHFYSSKLNLRVAVLAQPIRNISLLTQNTLMRGPDLPDWMEDKVCDKGILGSAIIGGVIGGPFYWVGGAAVGALLGCPLSTAVAEAAYDTFGVDNTQVDNIRRTDLVTASILNKSTRRSSNPSTGAYDIVALQEMFDVDMRSRLSSSLSSSYGLNWGPAGINGERINSGLVTLVNQAFSVQNHQVVPYTLATGWDAYANKGFSVTRIGLSNNPDAYFYLINTHTNATNDTDNNSDDEGALRAQLQQLGSYVSTLHNNDPQHPLLIVGDLNVPEFDPDGAQTLYDTMLSSFGMTRDDDLYRQKYTSPGYDLASAAKTSDGRRNTFAHHWFGGHRAKRLDYVLLKQGEVYKFHMQDMVMVDDHINAATYPAPWQVNEGACAADQLNIDYTQYGANSANEPYNSGAEFLCSYLSDHFGVRADLTLVRD